MYSEKGYQFAEVSHEITPIAGGPKVVRLAFQIDQGPKVRVADISFVGNEQMSERSLKGQMKNTREPWLFSFITKRGTYRPFGYEQDAVALEAHYRNNGYLQAQVGQPELEYLDVSENGKTRPVRLRIPVSEGERYRVGTVAYEGQEVLKQEALDDIFSTLRPGEYYSEADVRAGFDIAKEVYGSAGYYEMTAFPDYAFRTDPQPDGAIVRIEGDPVVDVTLHFQEGEQYFINRINFVGNNTTHDEVIRREVNMVERGVFNTEALKFSVRRINQLGYFEPLDEETAIQIEKRPGFENEVDLTLNLVEANLNQLTFGAGASQFDGFFLQLGFSTSNFLGRGETLSLSLQNGERVKNYNVGFTEPYVFGRPITAGVNVFRRDIRFINQFTQGSIGLTTSLGVRVKRWSQFFVAYSFEETEVTELNPAFLDPNLLRFNPFLQDALLIGQDTRTISKVTPTFLLNTVDHPIFPTTGKKYTLSFEYAGLGGNTQFYKPTAEGIWYLKHARRLSLGLRARAEYIAPIGSSLGLPIFSLLSMGGDFSLRGFDIRSIGPSDPVVVNDDGTRTGSGLVIGGNKSLLFNVEYLISIADPVRLVLFYDTGQVADFGQDFGADLFRTSTGVEVRFFMPVLNVPFRLIYVFNPQRGDCPDGPSCVLNDRFQPQEGSLFKFAIGTTF
jgi:outer membrane protein insertion porin family